MQSCAWLVPCSFCLALLRAHSAARLPPSAPLLIARSLFLAILLFLLFLPYPAGRSSSLFSTFARLTSFAPCSAAPVLPLLLMPLPAPALQTPRRTAPRSPPARHVHHDGATTRRCRCLGAPSAFTHAMPSALMRAAHSTQAGYHVFLCRWRGTPSPPRTSPRTHTAAGPTHMLCRSLPGLRARPGRAHGPASQYDTAPASLRPTGNADARRLNRYGCRLHLRLPRLHCARLRRSFQPPAVPPNHPCPLCLPGRATHALSRTHGHSIRSVLQPPRLTPSWPLGAPHRTRLRPLHARLLSPPPALLLGATHSPPLRPLPAAAQHPMGWAILHKVAASHTSSSSLPPAKSLKTAGGSAGRPPWRRAAAARLAARWPR